MKIIVYSATTLRGLYTLEGSSKNINNNIAALGSDAGYLDITGIDVADDPGAYRIEAGALIHSPRPSEHHTLDASGNWIDARTVAQHREAKLAALADLRWQKETAGIDVGGTIIKTDRESQASLGSAYVSLQAGLIQNTPWKAQNGWATVEFAQIAPIAQAVAQHVRACFAAEKAHYDAILALGDNAAAIDAYDITTGWPT